MSPISSCNNRHTKEIFRNTYWLAAACQEKGSLGSNFIISKASRKPIIQVLIFFKHPVEALKYLKISNTVSTNRKQHNILFKVLSFLDWYYFNHIVLIIIIIMDRLILTLLVLLLDVIQGRKYQHGHVSTTAQPQQAKLAVSATGGDECIWDSSSRWKAASSQQHRWSLSLFPLPC